jgi:hypothetical protein
MAGFNPSKDESNADYTGKLRTFSVDAGHSTILAPGDCVVLTGTADANGIAGADAAAAGAAFTGVIAGVDPIYSGENLSTTALPASTAGTIKCHVAQDLVYLVPVTGGNLAVTDVGLNADIDDTAASVSGGLSISNMALDSTTKATTSTLQFRIVQLQTDENGENLGSYALVRPNTTTRQAGAAGI